MGKNKYIETPEKMWELFQAYKKEVKDNPRVKVEYVGKEGQRVQTPIERPLSLEGFYTYCYNNASDVHHYFENTDQRYNDYRGICMRVRNAIKEEQIDGGMTGFYNASLTARINGLVEKREVDHSTQGKPMFGDNPLNK